MKKSILFACLLTASTFNVSAQLKVLSNGNVGINTSTPGYRLDVEGTGRFSNWTDVLLNWTGSCSTPVLFPENDWNFQLGKSNKRIGTIYVSGIHASNLWWDSDDSIKTNKEPISTPLYLIQQLNGRKYNYTSEYLGAMPDTFQNRTDYTKSQFGFMAREVLQILPDLVSFDSTTGIYSINYIGVIPIMSEAIKAQQTTIESLQNQINSMNNVIVPLQNCCGINVGKVVKKHNENTDNNASQTENNVKFFNASAPSLYQNNPNPFNDKTEIKFYLPAIVTEAQLIIYTLNGQQLNAIKLNNNGQGMQSVFIDGNNLGAGSYYYTLLVGNKEIDTKKMILLK
jgi:hypothetical protein